MEELKQNYQERLNNLHQFLYCELPLKLMSHSEDETCIDLQNRLYTLIETGYIKETEQQLQTLIEENYKLQNKENNKLLINGMSSGEARYVKQIAELQHQNERLSDELEEKNQLLAEVQGKMENFELLSDNIIKAEQALKELTNEHIELSQQLEYEQELNNSYKRQIEDLQQMVMNKESEQRGPYCSQQLLLLQDHVNSLRIDLQGLQAEIKIRMQMLEQFKSQLTSDLVKGFHTILSKTKQEQQNETIEVKKQLQQLNEQTSQQIGKLKKDIQFYKVLEEEYENKIKDVLNEKSNLEGAVKEKDEQLTNVANKLDLIQQNIEQTELNYQQQIQQVQNQRDKYKQQLQESKSCLQNLRQMVTQLQNQIVRHNKTIEEKVLFLEQQLKSESQELIEGLSQELSQSIETIKKQHTQIRSLELQCLKQNFTRTEVVNRNSEIMHKQTEVVERVKNDHSFVVEKSHCQRTGRLDEQRKYLDDLKQLHRTTKSQLKLNRKY